MFGIRVDANEIIGMGHVMRCLSIAEELRMRGEPVAFIIADRRSEKMIVSKDFRVICLHSTWDDLNKEVEGLVNVIETLGITTLLIDSYYVTETYLRAVRQYTRTIYIDDLDAFIYPVDVLVNYNIYAEDLCYAKRYREAGLDTQFVLGCSYAPLRAEFSNVNKEIKENISNILITSGGTDTYNVIGNILEMLVRQPWFSNLEYYIVLGRFSVHAKGLEKKWKRYENVHLLMNVSNMSEYMRCCDIAITAGGVTTYELCACGVPSVMYTLADNQLQIAQTVFKKNLIPWVGDIRENMDNCLDLIVSYIEKLSDVDRRREMSMKMQEIVDGKGGKRLVNSIVNV